GRREGIDLHRLRLSRVHWSHCRDRLTSQSVSADPVRARDLGCAQSTSAQRGRESSEVTSSQLSSHLTRPRGVRAVTAASLRYSFLSRTTRLWSGCRRSLRQGRGGHDETLRFRSGTEPAQSPRLPG